MTSLRLFLRKLHWSVRHAAGNVANVVTGYRSAKRHTANGGKLLKSDSCLETCLGTIATAPSEQPTQEMKQHDESLDPKIEKLRQFQSVNVRGPPGVPTVVTHDFYSLQ